MKKAVIGLALIGFLAFQPPAAADPIGDAVGGIGDLVTAVFAIPMGIVQGTLSGPPIIGTVGGALTGTVNALGSTLGGVFKLIRAAIPFAGAAAPYLPFVL